MPTPQDKSPFHRVVAFSSMLRFLRGSVDQTEDVVQNEVAAGTVGLELEALGVVHGLLLLVNLFEITVRTILVVKKGTLFNCLQAGHR